MFFIIIIFNLRYILEIKKFVLVKYLSNVNQDFQFNLFYFQVKVK